MLYILEYYLYLWVQISVRKFPTTGGVWLIGCTNYYKLYSCPHFRAIELNVSSDPADFTAQNNSMVTFAPSETKQNISVAIVNDDTLESIETFTAMLTATHGSMIGAAGTATATIIDDDCKPTSISVVC